MKKFRQYFLAQLKRVWKAFPFIALMTVLLVGCMAVISIALLRSYNSSDKKQKLEIGIAGDTSNNYISFGLMAVQMLDTSRFYVDFSQMSEEEAKSSLKAGEMTAYVVIPEGFAEAFDAGEDAKVTYAAANQASGLGSALTNEIVEIVSNVIYSSRTSINGIWSFMDDYDCPEDPNVVSDDLFAEFMNLFLGRTKFWSVNYLGADGSLGFISYYVIAIMILFILLWGITGSSLFMKRDVSLAKFLKAKGQGILLQISAEYLAYFVLMAGTMLMIFMPAVVVMAKANLILPEWQNDPVSQGITFVVRMLPAMALLAAFHFFLYELITNMVSGILFQFIMGLGLAYLSGCIYPLSFFPESIQRLVPFLPSGLAMKYGAGVMRGVSVGTEMAGIVLYLALFLGLAAIVRGRRMKA